MRTGCTGGPRGAPAVFALAFVGLGAWLFYNTLVLNSYEPGDLAEERAALYEKAYRQYKDLPQPRNVSMRTEVDIHPETRTVRIRGHYALVNKHAVPIDTLHVELWDELAVKKLEFAPHTVVSDDQELGHAMYKLSRPMASSFRASSLPFASRTISEESSARQRRAASTSKTNYSPFFALNL